MTVFGCVNFADAEQFVKAFNRERLKNPNTWLVYSGVIGGKSVEIKSFGTWNQILRVRGRNVSTVMGLSPGQWKKEIIDAC